jgi:hypothetical protein
MHDCLIQNNFKLIIDLALLPRKVAQMVTVLIHIREVLGSNLNSGIVYPE